MSFSIGLRVYRIHIQKAQDRSPIDFQKDNPRSDPMPFLREFVDSNVAINDHEDKQRSWFLEPKVETSLRNIRGYVKYGTYGFESNIIDRKTKTASYKRKATDLEEIPLFFQFWVPDTGPYGFAVFQSFQARSCVTLIIGSITERFKQRYPGYAISFRKLMPEDLRSSSLYTAPVKEVRLVKKSLPRDKADRYLKAIKPEEVEFSVSIRAKRKQSLSASILDFRKGADTPEGAAALLTIDGIQFDEAVAEVTVGGRRRTVGVLGYNSDAGTIEISDSVDWGLDGHPTFDSLSRESGLLLQDFHKTLSTN